jgi:glucose-6-phosphate isomerase
MPPYARPPLRPFVVTMDPADGSLRPDGPTLVRRMSSLEGLFADGDAWRAAVELGDPVVYEVVSSPVPESPRELPQSITTIHPGTTGRELWMTRGHQHPDPQGEIYLGLSGIGGLLLYDGTESSWLEMEAGSIGYIPPHWAHRSVNTGDEPFRFLAVYPGSAGHDYEWVLRHGMGRRVYRAAGGAGSHELVPFGESR